MKKFLFALLAALLVVGMFTAVAFAEAETNCNEGKHDYGDYVEFNFPDNPCTGARYKAKVCKICGEREAKEAWILVAEAQGHLFENTEIPVGATCIDGGKMVKKCARCGAEVEFTSTKSPEHKWVEAKEFYQAPTCTKTGAKKYVCAWCGDVKDETLDATGKHEFHLEYCDVAKRGSCTDWGTYKGKCIHCGVEFQYQGDDAAAKKDGTIVLKIPARGHDLRDVIVLKQVTCMEDGKISYACRNTKGTFEYEPCTYSVAEEKVDHNVNEPNLLTGTVINKYHNLKVEVLDTGKDTGYTLFVYKCTNKDCTYVSAQMTTKGTPNIQGSKANGDPTPVNTGSKPAESSTKKPSSSSSTNKKGVSIPKTNDSTSNLPYVLIAVAFVGLAALVASKKKVHG